MSNTPATTNFANSAVFVTVFLLYCLKVPALDEISLCFLSKESDLLDFRGVTLREEILARRIFGERAHSPILMEIARIYFGDLIKFLNLARINFGERTIIFQIF